MKICKLLLAAVGATVLLGALVSTASAGRLEISTKEISSMWRSVEFEGAFGISTRCQVTLDSTLHERTMVKRLGTLMGYITRAFLGTCSSGSATILTETLPWHVKYSGFSGTLPNITSIIVHVIGSSFRIREAGGITCLARTETNRPATGTFHRNTSTHFLTEVGIGGTIPTSCGPEGTFSSDSGPISVSSSSSTISVSLI